MYEDSVKLSVPGQAKFGIQRWPCNQPACVQVNTEAPTYQTPTGVSFRPQLATGSAQQQGAGNPGKTGLGSKSKARCHPQSTLCNAHIMPAPHAKLFLPRKFPGVCFLLPYAAMPANPVRLSIGNYTACTCMATMSYL